MHIVKLEKTQELLDKLAGTNSAGTDKQLPTRSESMKTSRWVSWRFMKDKAGEVEFALIDKAESNLFSRMMDRLDRAAGQARHTARDKLIQKLNDCGITINDDIRKSLPDTYKLGNVHTLRSAIEQQLKQHGVSTKITPEVLASQAEKYVDDFIKTGIDGDQSFLRKTNKTDFEKSLSSYSQQVFSKEMKEFAQDLLNLVKQHKAADGAKKAPDETIKTLEAEVKNTAKDFIGKAKSTGEWKVCKSGIETALEKFKPENEAQQKQKDNLSKYVEPGLQFALLSGPFMSEVADLKPDLVQALTDAGLDNSQAIRFFANQIVSCLKPA